MYAIRSYYELEFEVRDSICEAILEKLLEKINDEKLNILVIKVVSEWYDHWYSMPPGCKDLKFTCLNLEIRTSIKNVLEALIRELPSNRITSYNVCYTKLLRILNVTFTVMLQFHGMTSFIADAKDQITMDLAHGRRPDIVDAIRKTVDGDPPPMESLSKELQYYVKSANVILGKTLFSDSWLEV